MNEVSGISLFAKTFLDVPVALNSTVGVTGASFLYDKHCPEDNDAS